MILRNRYKVIVSFGLVLVVGLLIGILVGGSGPENRENILQLARPAFIDVASAEESAVIDTIVNEAGIAAYFKSATSVTLADVRDAFRTIEAETSSYILGSVQAPDYPERNDVHVYVHKDGWFLAYYLAADPTSKIYDWRDYSDSGHTDLTTKFDNTLEVMAAEATVAFAGATYYDFRNPNATNLMLIAEWIAGSGVDAFEVNLPGSFTYKERSWTTSDTGYDCSYSVDGNRIDTSGNVPYAFWSDWGTLTSSQLLPDQNHEISIKNDRNTCYGGLALVYVVP